MSSRRIRGFAVVVGAAVGAALGAALLNNPVAYADQPPGLPFGLQPYPDIVPPGSPGEPTGSEVSGIPYLLWNNQETVTYSIIDGYTRELMGEYVAKQDDSVGLPLTLNGSYFQDFGLLQNDSLQVIDSSGAAPAVGTEFGYSGVTIPLFNPITLNIWPMPVLQDYYESDPTGTTQELFQINLFGTAVGNYISSGPNGLLDELTYIGFGVFAIPILDIPAAASTAAVADAGSLWSDFAATF